MALTWDEDKNAWAGGPGVADAAPAAAAPTQAEFNALVTKFNTVLAGLRDAGIIATD
jgi:hypothetical protein